MVQQLTVRQPGEDALGAEGIVLPAVQIHARAGIRLEEQEGEPEVGADDQRQRAGDGESGEPRPEVGAVQAGEQFAKHAGRLRMQAKGHCQEEDEQNEARAPAEAFTEFHNLSFQDTPAARHRKAQQSAAGLAYLGWGERRQHAGRSNPESLVPNAAGAS